MCANNRTVGVFLDRKRLQDGRNFVSDFAKALLNSAMVVLILSHLALKNMVEHNPANEDNVLIEWLMALECFNHPNPGVNRINKIFPIMCGDLGKDNEILSFFHKDCNFFKLKDVVPTASIARATELLIANGVTPSAHFATQTVKSVVTDLSKMQGVFPDKFKNQKTKMAAQSAHHIMTVLRTCDAIHEDQQQNIAAAVREPIMASSTKETTAVGVVAADYSAAWQLLHDPTKLISGNCKAVVALLEELGAESAEDLADVGLSNLTNLGVLLKAAPQNKFRKAVGAM